MNLTPYHAKYFAYELTKNEFFGYRLLNHIIFEIKQATFANPIIYFANHSLLLSKILL